MMAMLQIMQYMFASLLDKFCYCLCNVILVLSLATELTAEARPGQI